MRTANHQLNRQYELGKLIVGGVECVLIGIGLPNGEFFHLSLSARTAIVLGGFTLAIMFVRELKSNLAAHPADDHVEGPRMAPPASKTRYP